MSDARETDVVRPFIEQVDAFIDHLDAEIAESMTVKEPPKTLPKVK